MWQPLIFVLLSNTNPWLSSFSHLNIHSLWVAIWDISSVMFLSSVEHSDWEGTQALHSASAIRSRLGRSYILRQYQFFWKVCKQNDRYGNTECPRPKMSRPEQTVRQNENKDQWGREKGYFHSSHHQLIVNFCLEEFVFVWRCFMQMILVLM